MPLPKKPISLSGTSSNRGQQQQPSAAQMNLEQYNLNRAANHNAQYGVTRKNSLGSSGKRSGQNEPRSGQDSQGGWSWPSFGGWGQGQGESKEETITRLTSDLNYLDEKNRGLKAHINGLEADIKALQEQKFRTVDKSRFTPMEDSVIQNELSSLQHEISQVSRKYSQPAGDELGKLSREEQQALIQQLQDIWIPGRNGPSAFITELMQTKILSRLCLTGLLSQAIHLTFFVNPFFVMKGVLKQPDTVEDDESRVFPPDTDWSGVFMNLWDYANDSDPKEANQWRAQTLRFLDSSPEQIPELPDQVRSRIKWAKQNACRRAASKFCTKPTTVMLMRHLEPEEDRSFLQEVIGVFEKAGDFAMRLWKQRVYVRCLGIGELHQVRYSVDSPVLQAHTAHVQDDPMDRSLDGKPVKIFVHPAIEAHGTHEAEEYTTRRIWAKAVVLLET